jgi:glycine dehydrogenase subunit 2
MRTFYGNFGVLVRAYAYIVGLGGEGLRRVSEAAVLNANYVMKGVHDVLDVPFKRRCMHEFVASASPLKERGVRATDVAKLLLDRGFHPPTVYFPLIVDEALMIEPTETESLENLDRLVEALSEIASIAELDPEAALDAPVSLPVARLDEVAAARHPVLRHEFASDDVAQSAEIVVGVTP